MAARTRKKTLRKARKVRKPSRSGAARPGPLRFFYWPTPNGHKIGIMLEETGLPHEMVPVDINKGEQFDPAFLKISPNNRMPAIIDPDGPGGRPVSVFESGAILQYLGRKTGRFYPKEERARVAVEEWLFWQVGGLGPMAGQANHFLHYADTEVSYARKRYTDEVHRLLGVMNTRLGKVRYLAGAYSIADMACFPWVRSATKYQSLDEFPQLAAWFGKMGRRPAVQRALAMGKELRKAALSEADKKVLFGQRAR